MTQGPKLHVLIISSRDDLDAGWERAQILKAGLEKTGITTKLVNKLGFNLEDLHLVARYRVVTTPSVLLFDGETVMLRRSGLPTAQELEERVKVLRDRARV